MYDSRLIGRWRSDGRKTLREIATRRDLSAFKKTKLGSLFGKLELRYTRTRCYSRLGDCTSVSRYQVVAKDSSSVAIVSWNPISGKQIHHIHFEDRHYWVSLGSGRMREFFRRLPRR